MVAVILQHNHVCFKIVYPTQNSQCPPGTAPKTKKTNAATISVLPREQARERDDVVTQEAEIHMFVVMPRFLNLVLATCICYLPPSILARSPFLGPPCGVERRSGGGLAGCFTQRTDQQQFKPRNGMGWQKTAYNNGQPKLNSLPVANHRLLSPHLVFLHGPTSVAVVTAAASHCCRGEGGANRKGKKGY